MVKPGRSPPAAPRPRPQRQPSRPPPPGEVRIIGGLWKRSRLPVLPGLPDLRPTPARVRETLFDWLGQRLDGWRCVDAFAGTGALGFEAASRGAAEVVLVEQDAKLATSLEATRLRLQADTVRVTRGDGLAWLARAPRDSLDLVLLDPPFGRDLARTSLQAAARALAAGGFVYVEAAEPLDAPPAADGEAPLVVHRRLKAGAVHATLLRRH